MRNEASDNKSSNQEAPQNNNVFGLLISTLYNCEITMSLLCSTLVVGLDWPSDLIHNTAVAGDLGCPVERDVFETHSHNTCGKRVKLMPWAHGLLLRTPHSPGVLTKMVRLLRNQLPSSR
jgi:hypothetical protein